MLDLEKRCRREGLATADLEDMAYVCWEAHRAWCRSRGDFRLVAWPEADMGDRDEARDLALQVIEGQAFDLSVKAAIFRAIVLALVRHLDGRFRPGDTVPSSTGEARGGPISVVVSPEGTADLVPRQ